MAETEIFISYAQNLEDVILWRALGHIKQGFYIDVGAAWPSQDSVTKVFYERGWRGINIEPNPSLYAELIDQRPRDINLRIAVGASKGLVVFNIIKDTGLSSLDPTISRRHAKEGWEVVEETVEVSTLSDIIEANTEKGQDIHFLKIDVEGLEREVIRGNDWSMYRPWVLIVESTKPLSKVPSYSDWEPLLLSEGYIFCYADGLNRFYIANEHSYIAESMEYPPNIFDKYRRSDEVSQAEFLAFKKASQLETKRAILEAERLLNELTSIYMSRSWIVASKLNYFRTICGKSKQRLRRLYRPDLLLKQFIKKVFWKAKDLRQARLIAFWIQSQLSSFPLRHLASLIRSSKKHLNIYLSKMSGQALLEHPILTPRAQSFYEKLSKNYFPHTK